MLVARHVALVVDLDDRVAVAAVEQPGHRVLDTAPDRRLVVQPLVLPEVEQADDRDHAELVHPVEDRLEPGHVGWPQVAVGGEGGVDPGLQPAVALRRPALQVQRQRQQPVPPVLGQHLDELARVALRLPGAGVRVSPAIARVRVEVIERRLDHARVEQQPLDPVAVPVPPPVGRLAVDPEVLAPNLDARLPGHRRYPSVVTRSYSGILPVLNGQLTDRTPLRIRAPVQPFARGGVPAVILSGATTRRRRRTIPFRMAGRILRPSGSG